MLREQTLINLLETVYGSTNSWQPAPQQHPATSKIHQFQSFQLFLLEVFFFFSLPERDSLPPQLQTQQCDCLHLSKHTKYLALSYFTTTIQLNHNIDEQQVGFWVLSCLTLAIKFGENLSISEAFLSGSSFVVNSSLQLGDLAVFEARILQLLNFRLHIISPYALATVFQQQALTITSQKLSIRQVVALIDFAITLPAIAVLPARIVFLACLLIIYSQQLGEAQRELIGKIWGEALLEGAQFAERELQMQLEKVLKQKSQRPPLC